MKKEMKKKFYSIYETFMLSFISTIFGFGAYYLYDSLFLGMFFSSLMTSILLILITSMKNKKIKINW